MENWKIETKDDEVSDQEEITVAKTVTIVSERMTLAQVKAEIKAKLVEKDSLQARIAEINARVTDLRALKDEIEASKVKLKAVEEPKEDGME